MRVHNNKNTIFVWLSDKLFNDLKAKIEEYNKENDIIKLRLPQAAYFVNLVIYIPTTRKDKYEDGWVPICSEIHKNIKHFSKYMKFLVDSKFLIVHEKKYSNKGHFCKKFKLVKKYRMQNLKLREIEGHKSFVKNRQKAVEERKKKADKSCGHLTKWLNSGNFTVDYDAAKAFIKKKYYSKKDKNKREHRIIAIDKIQHQISIYSREGKDNRLHTNFTSMPKDLKNFVKFRNFPLVSIDIKNSQPFILSTLIQQVINNEYSLYNINKGITGYLNSSPYTPIMSDLIDQNYKTEGLQTFIDEVQKGVFYEKFAEILYDEDVIMRNKSGKHFYKGFIKGEGMITKDFETKRAAAKFLVFKVLFSSHTYEGDVVKAFTKHYKDVSLIIKRIKSYGDDKGFFPSLLQNIEADCILDYCTKKIANKYPDIR